jgi:hypothetical protein
VASAGRVGDPSIRYAPQEKQKETYIERRNKIMNVRTRLLTAVTAAIMGIMPAAYAASSKDCNTDISTCLTDEDGITCKNAGTQCNNNAKCHCAENTTWSLGCQCFKDAS